MLLGLWNVWLLIAPLFLLYALGLGLFLKNCQAIYFAGRAKLKIVRHWVMSFTYAFADTWCTSFLSQTGECVTRFYTCLVCFGFILFNSLFVHMKWLAEFVFTFHLFRVPRLIYEGSVSSGSWWCDIWLIIFFPQALISDFLSRSYLILCFCNLITTSKVTSDPTIVY